MLALRLSDPPGPLHVLCIGAHSDDIEIGCAATLLTLAERGYQLRVTWVVLSARDERAAEAKRSALALLGEPANVEVELAAFRDSYFPAEFESLKRHLGELRQRVDPDVVFSHCLDDRHQDHRLVAELTWQAWRDHLILEYEIPKYEGDLGRPNVYVPVSRHSGQRKVDHLLANFGTQRSKGWFNAGTFDALMRLRGIECRASDGLAEAFIARKIVL
jgi:LmbE family N-acetylglucosaminyl deacetylase